VKPPASPFAQRARFQEQALQAFTWGKRQASAIVLPVLSLAYPLLSRRSTSPKSQPLGDEDQEDRILITVLGGNKEDWGNTSSIDATRRRKLSPSLLPRGPRPSQLTKLL
jgi:hypothetical protein